MDEQSPGKKRKLNRFRFVEQLGRGTYGDVYKAYDMDLNCIRALKKVNRFHQSDGLPLSFYREKKYLQSFENDNIVKTYGTFMTENSVVYIILEYCESDLQKHLYFQPLLHPTQIKNIMFQLLNGLSVIHSNNVAHRDIKPSNILLKDGSTIKIADFGLAREMNSDHLTNRVSSLAYRAPELILGSQNYTTSVDIWSAGVIFYELATGEKFPSKGTDLSQLDAIFRIIGTPHSIDSLCQLPQWRLAEMLNNYPRQLEQLLMNKLPEELLDAAPLIESMLQADPSSRPSAEDLLHSHFFSQMESMIPLPLPEISEIQLDISSPRTPIIRPSHLLLEVA